MQNNILWDIASSVIALQVSKQFLLSGAEDYIGGFLGVALIREIAPGFAALAIGARAGTAITAQIANMKVTSQVDAMKVLGVNPIGYYFAPRIIAGAFGGSAITDDAIKTIIRDIPKESKPIFAACDTTLLKVTFPLNVYLTASTKFCTHCPKNIIIEKFYHKIIVKYRKKLWFFNIVLFKIWYMSFILFLLFLYLILYCVYLLTLNFKAFWRKGFLKNEHYMQKMNLKENKLCVAIWANSNLFSGSSFSTKTDNALSLEKNSGFSIL